jgi:hypothetical protein
MEPLEITFKIEAPQTLYQSDINTLILRIDKLRQFYNNIFFDRPQSNIDVEEHNKNIECIEEILQHMKFKTIDK